MKVSTRTSITPNFDMMTVPGRTAGFTLVEILVVLFIVSVMTGIAVANMPALTRTGDFDIEARRLKVLIDLAREEALLQSAEFGLLPERNSYQFLLFDDVERTWSPLKDRPFQQRKLDDGIELWLIVEDDEFSLGDDDEDQSPPVLLLSSGETTPFRLQILKPGEDLSRTLVADGFGDVIWSRDEVKE